MKFTVIIGRNWKSLYANEYEYFVFYTGKALASNFQRFREAFPMAGEALSAKNILNLCLELVL